MIASISLGTTRTFQLRSKRDRKIAGSVGLEHGSLLLMEKNSQAKYQHAIPKEPPIAGERVNLTFRVTGVASVLG
jgi:alkylated DNA repair dioxygenase AlkB